MDDTIFETDLPGRHHHFGWIENRAHLIASHIQARRCADDEKRLDGENGLLLTHTIDHLFDRGFISFHDSGRLLVSPVTAVVSLERMGLETSSPVEVGTFSSGQKEYLDYHRNFIFLEAGARRGRSLGRRVPLQ